MLIRNFQSKCQCHLYQNITIFYFLGERVVNGDIFKDDRNVFFLAYRDKVKQQYDDVERSLLDLGQHLQLHPLYNCHSILATKD